MVERQLSPEERAVKEILDQHEQETLRVGERIKHLLLEIADDELEDWPEFRAVANDPVGNTIPIEAKGIVVEGKSIGIEFLWYGKYPPFKDSIILTSSGLFIIPTAYYSVSTHYSKTAPMFERGREALPEEYIKYSMKAVEAINIVAGENSRKSPAKQ